MGYCKMEILSIVTGYKGYKVTGLVIGRWVGK